MYSVIVNAIELRLLLASVPVRLTMVMADSLRDGQRDPTRHGDVFQVNVNVNLFRQFLNHSASVCPCYYMLRYVCDPAHTNCEGY